MLLVLVFRVFGLLASELAQLNRVFVAAHSNHVIRTQPDDVGRSTAVEAVSPFAAVEAASGRGGGGGSQQQCREQCQ